MKNFNVGTQWYILLIIALLKYDWIKLKINLKENDKVR